MLTTHLLKILGCDLWWGIDGELKSKFGELTENFWQSGAKNGNLQAIYLTSEGGGGSEGKSLSELKGGDGEPMISIESGGGDQVESAFGFCVGGQNTNENSCKNSQGKSVVMVGEERLNENELKSGWRRWSMIKESEKAFQQQLDFNGLELLSNDRRDTKVVRFARQPHLDKLRKLFKRAEPVAEQSFIGLQAWFCPDGSGNVSNKCKSGEILKGQLPDGLKGISFPLFVKDRVKNDFLGNSGFKGEKEKLGGLLLLLELWSREISKGQIESAGAAIRTKMEGWGFDQKLGTLRLLTYHLSDDGSSISKLRYNDKAKVGNIKFKQDGHNGSDSELVIENFGGHLGVRFGGETISSEWFRQLDDSYLKTVWSGFGLETDMIKLFDSGKGVEERMWLLITLLLSANFDLSQGISVSVSPISNAGKVVLQNLEKK